MTTTTSSRTTTEESVQEAFARWTSAWNRQDVEAYIDAYWDSDQTRYVGADKVYYGKGTIAQGIRDRGIRGHLSTHDMQISAMGNDDDSAEALVFAWFRLAVPPEDENNNDSKNETVYHGVFTVHVRRIGPNQEWKIISDHSSAMPAPVL